MIANKEMKAKFLRKKGIKMPEQKKGISKQAYTRRKNNVEEEKRNKEDMTAKKN